MTTVKEILDKFNLDDLYTKNIQNIDIGNYTFTDVDESTLMMFKFTNPERPDIVFFFNADKLSMMLCEIQPDDTVEVTSWRNGDKIKGKFHRKDFKI